MPWEEEEEHMGAGAVWLCASQARQQPEKWTLQLICSASPPGLPSLPSGAVAGVTTGFSFTPTYRYIWCG